MNDLLGRSRAVEQLPKDSIVVLAMNIVDVPRRRLLIISRLHPNRSHRIYRHFSKYCHPHLRQNRRNILQQTPSLCCSYVYRS